MDSHILKNKLKKYLFFISIVFFIATLTHLLYIYTYYDSILKAQKWWTISESFIWKFPNLNPIKYQRDDYNNYINHILYRSLSKYNNETKEIISDLADCNIKDTKKIECYLTDNIKWSNWDDITIDDILATYNSIQQYNTNPIIQNILDKIEIKTTKNSIIFSSNIKDVNILNILFQPILSKTIIDNLDEQSANWSFSPIDWVYSWYYIISKTSNDSTSWNTKIFLEKNNLRIKNPIYIDNLIFKFYDDYTKLLKQKNNINIFFDKNHLIWDTIPKLNEHKYILPQYIWLFINKDKLEYPNLRNYILNSINKKDILHKIWDKYNKIINSPFLESNLEININKKLPSLQTMLHSIGYYTKETYINRYNQYKQNPNLYSQEIKIQKNNSWSLKKDKKEIDITSIKNSITKNNYNSHSKIITYPAWVDKYNYIKKPNITIIWKVNNNKIDNIYINDLKLKDFVKWQNKFSYKISPKLNNIKLWKNTYKIFFEENGKKILQDEINFFYATNKKTLDKYEIDLIADLINKKINTKKEDILKEKKITKIISPAINSDIQAKIAKIQALNSNYYYNTNLEPYSLNLVYINWSNEIEKAAMNIKEQLEKKWIKINISSIKIKELTNKIKNNKESYHILLAWENLWYFNFDISKYFYSWQINKWTNFSKIKNSNLDNILEDLKWYPIIDKNKRIKQQKEILKILEKENIFIPLYSPYYSNLVTKDINWYTLNKQLVQNKYRFDPLIKSYILKQKEIKKDNKWFLDFLRYITYKLFLWK